VRIGSYEFDIKRARSELKEIEAEKIILQLPDGLRHKSKEFIKEFDQKVTLWGGTCYGACDVPSDIGDNDALVHIGHVEIPNLDVGYKIIYLPGKSVRFHDVPEELFEDLVGKVGLYASIQYLHQLEELREMIDKRGYETIIGEGDDRIKYPGQVLGCNYSVRVKDADTHLYVGTGRFHPLGLSFTLDEDVLIYNPSTGEVQKIGEKERDEFRRKRFAAINIAKESSKIGIVVSRKKGQKRKKIAEELLTRGEKAGKEMILIELDEINKRSIDYLDLDCIVITACPRIVLDDAKNYDTVLLTPDEFEIALGKKEWKDWKLDEID